MRLIAGLISLGLALTAVVAWWPGTARTANCRLIFFDVGQGDAILIQTPDKQDVLIDGGPDDRLVSLLPRQLGPGNDDLELVVLTHPDSDHVRGLVDVLDRVEVGTVWISDVQTNTEVYDAWRDALAARDINPRIVSQGQRYSLGQWLRFEVLWPPAAGWAVNGAGTPTNEASVILRVVCAGSTAVFTGDASSAVEDRILASGHELRARLFKAGHHGSRSSTSHAFLRAVGPTVAVISVGEKNRYGHPHPAVLERLKMANIEVFRTDLLGTIRFQSDGSGGWRLTP